MKVMLMRFELDARFPFSTNFSLKYLYSRPGRTNHVIKHLA